jgi:hypothetical protein
VFLAWYVLFPLDPAGSDADPSVLYSLSLFPQDWTINNHFLIYGPSWSGVGASMLDLACEMSYDKKIFQEKYMAKPYKYGGPGQWYWLCALFATFPFLEVH